MVCVLHYIYTRQNKETEDDDKAAGKRRKGDNDDDDGSGEPRRPTMTAAEREALREANDRYQRASQAHARLRSGDGDALSALQVTLRWTDRRVVGQGTTPAGPYLLGSFLLLFSLICSSCRV